MTPTAVLECCPTVSPKKSTIRLDDPSATLGISIKLFDELKGRIKLDDESLHYKDHTYEYWTKTTVEGNYSIKLRRKIETNKIEEIWNGDK